MPRIVFALAALVSSVGLFAAVAGADTTPIGAIPAGPVSSVVTPRNTLVSVALPHQKSGLVWRLARDRQRARPAPGFGGRRRRERRHRLQGRRSRERVGRLRSDAGRHFVEGPALGHLQGARHQVSARVHLRPSRSPTSTHSSPSGRTPSPQHRPRSGATGSASRSSGTRHWRATDTWPSASRGTGGSSAESRRAPRGTGSHRESARSASRSSPTPAAKATAATRSRSSQSSCSRRGCNACRPRLRSTTSRCAACSR